MERRKFFKSLGLLSIAAVLPKFLFSKDEKPVTITGYNIQNWADRKTHFSMKIVNEVPDLNKDVVWDGYILIDYSVKPKNMMLSEWYEYLEKGTLFYDGKQCGIKPREFKESLLDGSNRFVTHNVIKHKAKRKIPINVSKLQVIDYVSGWRIDFDNFCNYMSIERYPS